MCWEALFQPHASHSRPHPWERLPKFNSSPRADQDLAYRVFESQPTAQLHDFLSCLSESQPRVALFYLLNLNLFYYIIGEYPITGDKIFINMNKNILNKLISNWFQEHIQSIIQYDQIIFISEIQKCFNIHKCNNLIRKKEYTLMIKVMKNLEVKGAYFNIIKAIYSNSTANSLLRKKNSKHFHKNQENNDVQSQQSSSTYLKS